MGRSKYNSFKASKTLWLDAVPIHWQETDLRMLYFDNKVKNDGLIERNLLSLSYGKLKRKDIDNATGLVPASFEGYQIIEKDFIVLRFTDLQNDKKSLRVGFANEKGIITSAYIGLSPKVDLYSKYYYYLLHYLDKIKYYYNLGGGVRQSLSFKDFGRETVLVPEKTEQIAIANFLDYKLEKIERFINKKKQLIELLNEQKAAIINQAVTKGLNPNAKMKASGIEWLGDIPEHWNINKIKFLITKPVAGQWGQEEQKNANDIICLRVADFNELTVKSNDLTIRNIEPNDEQILVHGDLLIEKSGGGEKTPVGRVVMFTHNFKAVTSNFVSKVSAFNSLALSDYLLYIFKAINNVRWNVRSIKQTTGIQNLDSYDYFDNWIYIPEKKEQKDIVLFIKSESVKIEKTITNIQKEIDLVEEYKTALIAEAVTGKIDVQDFEIPQEETPLAMVAEEAANYNKQD